MSERERQKLVLDTAQLSKIKDELAINGFPDTKWFDLGLTLGLKHATLTAIEADHRGNVNRCLSECLNKWLSKADDVPEVGPPTWKSLGKGLRRVNEVTVAEKVLKMADPASQLLQCYSDRLSQVVFSEKSLLMLRNEGVISNETLAEIESCGDRLLRGPLRAVCTTAAEDHNKLRVLATVLLKSEDTVSLANEMIQEYGKIFPSSLKDPLSPRLSGVVSGHSTPVSASGSTDMCINQGTLEIPLDPDNLVEFDRMRDGLGSLIHTIAPLIEAKIPSLKDLKIFLRRCRRELKPQLENATTFDEVMELIEDKCSVINITLLECIVSQYLVTDADEHISAYKIKLEEFCKKENSLRICDNIQLKTFFSSHLICETIKFTLNWEIDKRTLNDIRNLLSKAFKDRAKRVEVVVIKEDNSVTIICYAPDYLMESLLLIARENLDELKEMGLMSLTIGYYTVCDQGARDKEILQLEEENKLLAEQLDLFKTEKDVGKIQDGGELLISDNQQEDNTQARKRGHPNDEDDPSLLPNSRKPCYSDDEPTTTRQTNRKRSHSLSSDAVSSSKMIALKHDDNILRQSVVEKKESEIEHFFKLLLAKKEEVIQDKDKIIRAMTQEMEQLMSSNAELNARLMKKELEQELCAKAGEAANYQLISLTTADGSTSVHKSVPLFYPNNMTYDETSNRLTPNGERRSSLHICPVGMELLANIHKPIAVLSIAGPTGTGKTYILSRMLDSHDAFSSQPPGIWIGTHALEYEDYVLVLLDTEGIDVVPGDFTNNLVMTLLMSSFFIYNTASIPRPDDFEKLRMLMTAAQSAITTEHKDELQHHFPRFWWLLRNFTLKLYQKMTPKEYLRSNDTKFELSKFEYFFPSFDVFTLPPPSDDPDVLRNVAAHHEELVSEFLRQVKDLISVLRNDIAAISSCKAINGQTLAQLAQQYNEALNSSDSSALENILFGTT